MTTEEARLIAKQRFDRAKFTYREALASHADAVAKKAAADKLLDDLLNRPDAKNESTCPELLAIAQAATQARIAQEAVANTAQQVLQAQTQLESAAWDYYWTWCPE